MPLTELGLPTAHTEIGRFGSHAYSSFDASTDVGLKTAIVTRMARVSPPCKLIARLPQEDFAVLLDNRPLCT